MHIVLHRNLLSAPACHDGFQVVLYVAQVEERVDVIEFVSRLSHLVIDWVPVLVLVVVPPICSVRHSSICSPQVVHWQGFSSPREGNYLLENWLGKQSQEQFTSCGSAPYQVIRPPCFKNTS